jgi:filamentous hemagglutinin family protein
MRWRLITAAVALALASLDARAQQAIPASALPTGGRLAGGQATISQSGTAMSIVQGTPRAVLDWQSFNIGANASVVFRQPSANAVALNRVIGGDPSQIFGRLSSNGQLFLTNPSGILFGRGAQIDVGGILATTLAMSTDEFMSGKNLLRGNGTNSAILNQGTLRSAPKGYVALIAPLVRNEGTIDASRGTAALVAANAATVDFMADGLIQIKVDQGAITAEITNKGAIRADGGTVFLTARGLDGLARSVVNNSGIIEARAVENVKGVVRLSGGEVSLQSTSSISADGGGQIEVQGGIVLADGRIDASNSSGVGGTIKLLGDMVGLVGNARVDASGDTGGGTILVGGDRHGDNPDIQNAWRTYVGPDAVIKANAITSGGGGKVIVWADDWTKYYGSIEARAACVGRRRLRRGIRKNNLDFNGRVDVRRRLILGTVLLDPRDITVVRTRQARRCAV